MYALQRVEPGTRGNWALSFVLGQLEAMDPGYCSQFDYDMLFALPAEPGCRTFWKRIAPHWVIR